MSRIGRAKSVLCVRARTQADRSAGAEGVDAGELRRRICAAAASAADPLFDFAPYRSVNLAGMGTVPTFHFQAAGAAAGDGAQAAVAAMGATLAGLGAVAPPPNFAPPG